MASLEVQWLGLQAFIAEGMGSIQSLVGELRSHKLCSVVKEGKKQTK